MIVLFPPLDIISAFPLNAVTLGNNLLTTFVLVSACLLLHAPLELMVAHTQDPQKRAQRRFSMPFRIIAAAVPCIGAAIVRVSLCAARC